MNGETKLFAIPSSSNPDGLMRRARQRWNPVRTYCLFSGGNDSGVLAHYCQDYYDELLFIDTGTCLPGVEEHVVAFAEWLERPLKILRSGGAYREMVLGGRRMSNGRTEEANGFPGSGQHGRAYIRLKERRIEECLRETKVGHSRTATVLFLSGVRRAESKRRQKREPFSERRSAKFVSPLIDWSGGRMREYREHHELPQSDVAALLHRSGECNCGAFAKAEEERAMLKSLWPEWFAETIESLEIETEAAGIRWCRWGGYDLDGMQAARSSQKPGLPCSTCTQLELAA